MGTKWQNQTQKELIVFDIKKTTLIAERQGDNISLFCNDHHDKKNILNSFLVANFCEIREQKPLRNYLFFNQTKIFVVDSLGIYPNDINPDIIILSKSPKINLERMCLKIHPKLIIADASNYKSYINTWKTSCYKDKIPFHATTEKGFYRIK